MEDLNVEITDTQINIKGERKYEESVDYLMKRERCYGKFQRSIMTPTGADASKAVAKFQDGVLNITIPKLAPTTVGGARKLNIDVV